MARRKESKRQDQLDTLCSRAGDATPVITVSRERRVNEACVASHRKPSHARSAVMSRAAEVCFEVTTQTWERLSSSGDAMSRRGTHRCATLARPTKPHVTEQWVAMMSYWSGDDKWGRSACPLF